jgi:hypothetical protein
MGKEVVSFWGLILLFKHFFVLAGLLSIRRTEEREKKAVGESTPHEAEKKKKARAQTVLL